MTTSMDHEGRVEKVRGRLGEEGIDALLVTDLTNVQYLTGFTGTNGQVLVAADGALFLSDTRYEARAGMLVRNAEIVIYPLNLWDVLKDRVTSLGITRLGVEAAEMTLSTRDTLAERLDGVELVPTKKVVEQIRRAKEPAEVELLERAVRVADEAFDWLLDNLVPGMRERQIALDLEIRMRRRGADAVSFEPIVAAGPLSAHIHHSPSDREIEKGDIVLLDFGCKVEGYCSDMTRSVVVGPATDAQKETYELVLEAQLRGIEASTVGRSCREVDAAARDVIGAAGRADEFGHGLGHGVGLDIHEEPRMNREAKDSLVENDVVTVEPGLYVVDFGGIRIEDCVVVTAAGPRVLTTARKDTLIEL
ncbi:MAG: M24 family metallopeptidase [Actinobacteria bacterium]|nr:M24 family metallopeptidase [Actinomycetota bacterium]